MKIGKNDLIALAMVVFVAVVIWNIWVAVSAPGELKSEHWLGLIGNLVGGGMTLVAAAVAWVSVRNSLDETARVREQETKIEATTLSFLMWEDLSSFRKILDLKSATAGTVEDGTLSTPALVEQLQNRLHVLGEAGNSLAQMISILNANRVDLYHFGIEDDDGELMRSRFETALSALDDALEAMAVLMKKDWRRPEMI